MANRKPSRLKIIPLGGVEEIGKNMTLIEYGNDILVVDCGLAFPTEEMPGIDLVIPDITYLEKNIHKVRAFIITHGHEDHIGALPYVLRRVNVPVYGTKLTTMLIEYKLTESGLKDVQLETVTPREKRTFGNLTVEFIKTSHSILDSVALAITTPLGVVLITGDFKVDFTPVEGQVMDLARFAQLGEEGVLLLLCDSTNIERPGYTMSEKQVGVNMDEFFRTAKGRIIISTFSSNIHRIQQIVDSAKRYGRKVCFTGRSMIKIATMAQDLGYLKVCESDIVPIEKINSMQSRKVVIITTGSQGEPMSGLVRMADGDHHFIGIKEGDTVIISAAPIPGNEKFVNRVIDLLFRRGANVVYNTLAEIHASGHACREEIKLIHTLTKPRYFMPVHGEYRHLRQHALLAESLGMSPKNIFIPQNGKVLTITRGSAQLRENVTAGGVLVDGTGIGDVGNLVLRDRLHLAEDGLVIAVITLSREDGSPVTKPDVITRGFVSSKEAEEIIELARARIRNIVSKSRKTPEWNGLKTAVRNDLRKLMYEKTKRRPMILPIVVEV